MRPSGRAALLSLVVLAATLGTTLVAGAAAADNGGPLPEAAGRVQQAVEGALDLAAGGLALAGGLRAAADALAAEAFARSAGLAGTAQELAAGAAVQAAGLVAEQAEALQGLLARLVEVLALLPSAVDALVELQAALQALLIQLLDASVVALASTVGSMCLRLDVAGAFQATVAFLSGYPAALLGRAAEDADAAAHEVGAAAGQLAAMEGGPLAATAAALEAMTQAPRNAADRAGPSAVFAGERLFQGADDVLAAWTCGAAQASPWWLFTLTALALGMAGIGLLLGALAVLVGLGNAALQQLFG